MASCLINQKSFFDRIVLGVNGTPREDELAAVEILQSFPIGGPKRMFARCKKGVCSYTQNPFDFLYGRSPNFPRTQRGRYSLSIHGLDEVKKYLADKPVPRESLALLENAVGRVSDETERKFLAEAVACVQVEAKRAVIVMTWLLAIHHLQEYVLQAKLNDFNSALKRRGDTKNLTIRKKDDFGDLKESDFIEVARSAGVISNDVRKILNEKLGIRNSCAHPSDIEIHDSKVQNFIEDLVDNVIRKYTI